MSDTNRALICRLAAHERWADLGTAERQNATAPARQAFEDRFLNAARERYGDLPADELARRAANIRSAYFARLALKSVEARRARKAGKK